MYVICPAYQHIYHKNTILKSRNDHNNTFASKDRRIKNPQQTPIDSSYRILVGGHCEDCLPYKRESYLTRYWPLSMGETSVGHHALLCQALPASYSCASLAHKNGHGLSWGSSQVKREV